MKIKEYDEQLYAHKFDNLDEITTSVKHIHGQKSPKEKCTANKTYKN